MLKEDFIEIEYYRRYQHRFNFKGEPLHYVGIVATKNKELNLSDLNL